MSSTYSTNLAIELIGTGDQAGTWGTTTNTNLGTLIEQAISGYVTQAITDGADTVITIPNGATGTARNMAIECTGILSAARNLIVPANKKLYLIYNNTSGGYAVTVKVSGQTGVSVPNGAKVWLVSNGTDIVVATNYMAALTLGTALPVASGGTGATTLTSAGILRGNGTSAISVASGTDITTAIAANPVTNATNATNVVSGGTIASNVTATTQAAKTSDTTVSTTAFTDRLRSLLSSSTTGTLALSDRGSLVSITAGITVPASIFSANDVVSIYNNTASTLTITQGAGLTLRFVGTANTGNRTLTQRGLVTIMFVSATEAVISGGGLA